jgi:N-acetylglucosamine-6-sulfatase
MKNTPILIIALLFAPLAALHSADKPKPKKPNILYIMSDDHAAHAIGAYGGRLAALNPTPTIDRLAREGMLFGNVFASNAICVPSRATILTGQYAHVHGVVDLGGGIVPSEQHLAIEMKKAGYEASMIGKWHLKHEPAAFDHYCVLPGQGKYHDPEFQLRGPKGWPRDLITFEGEHSTDVITDLSLKWLFAERDPDKPFFLMLHFKAPHDYFEHAARYDDWLADTEIPQPLNLLPEHRSRSGSIATLGHQGELIPHIGTSIGKRNPRRSYAVDLPSMFPQDFPPGYDPAALSEAEIQRLSYNAYLRKYLRCIKGIDDNLARLFAQLEEAGLMDETIIIYTADQGFMLGEHDYQDKRWAYEESMRMPFLIRHPGSIPAGTRSDAIVENVDFAPTLLDIAGAEIPASMQGKSFRSICATGAEPEGWKQEAYYRYWMHMAHHDNPGHLAIRTKTHKLIYYYGCNYEGGYQTPPGWELYDLEADPGEDVNLYDDPARAPLVAELKERLAELRTRVGDTGEHFPKAEAVVREFWDYDGTDRARAIEISAEFRRVREAELLDAAKAGEKAAKGAAK